MWDRGKGRKESAASLLKCTNQRKAWDSSQGASRQSGQSGWGEGSEEEEKVGRGQAEIAAGGFSSG